MTYVAVHCQLYNNKNQIQVVPGSDMNQSITNYPLLT